MTSAPPCQSAKLQLKLEQLESRDAPAVFTVTATADAGAGSLRQAILDANARPGADTIRFQIASGPQTITPTTALPDVTDTVTLDATTQPGYADTPLIILDGSAAPVGASGLVLANHTGSTIREFEIVNFSKDFTGSFVDAAGINVRNGGGHTIQGDYIGTDGTTALPNGYAGILINNSANNLIGGASAAARNVIAGNRGAGVYVANSFSTGNKVQGNYIGTDAAGTHAIPNGAPTMSIGGVVIAGFGAGGAIPNGKNVIGGTDPGAGNLIAFERFAVQVVGSSGNSILGNTMHDDGAGILLDGAFHTNDTSDTDAGGNNGQNQPVITGIAANPVASNTKITGTLNSTPNTQFRIEVFHSGPGTADTTDAWGNGQGEALIGSVTVTTDAAGNASFTVTTTASMVGSVVATATNLATGDTSTFSAPRFVPVTDPAPTTRKGYAVAAASGEPRVWLYAGDGTLVRTFLAYDPSFRGGVHVATADVNGDGVLDVITGAGAGGGPHVKVFDGQTGTLLTEFYAYDARFTGGVNVAAADLTGDGEAEVITGAGPGGGPHVKAFDLATGQLVASFFAYDARFTGGVSVAAGDVDGDGKADIVTGAGPGGGPHLRVWSGATGQVVKEMFAYDPTFTGGLSVAVGDFDGDGKADIAVGPQTGGPAQVRVLTGSLTALKDIVVFENDYRGGTTVIMRDTDGDGMAEVLVGVKNHGKPKVIAVKASGTPADALTPDAGAPEGVFVG